MYSANQRSRIARETFWILKALAEHFRALLRMEETDTVRTNHILTLLAIYMLHEEGIKFFKPKDVVEATGLSKSSVYRALEWLFDRGVLEREFGKYQCNSRTPDFLINPEELYQRPIKVVQDKNYEHEEMVAKALQEFQEKIPQIIADTIGQGVVPLQRDPPEPSTYDSGRFTRPESHTPSASVEDVTASLMEDEKPPEENKKTKIEKKLKDMFM